MRNWGVLRLPTRVHKNQAIYDEGHYFIMRFDTSSPTQEKVRTTLSLDPRMVRFSSVKLGDGKLLPGKGSGVRGRGLADFGSRIPWRDEMGVVPKSTK